MTADIVAIGDIVRLMQQPPFAMSLTTSWQAFLPCCDALGDILVGNPEALSESHLQAIASVLETFSTNQTAVDLSPSRLGMIDLEQRFFTDDGAGDGYLYPVSDPKDRLDFLLTKALIPLKYNSWKKKSASRKEHREKVDQLFKLTEGDCTLPYWEFNGSSAARELQELQTPYWFLVTTMFPDLAGVFSQGQQSALQADATRVGVALQLFRFRNGNWPASLEILVPSCLPAVPLDRYDGQPLRYKLVDGAPRIYSVYLDKVDDGGKPAPDTDPNATIVDVVDPERTGKGDLILWPALKAMPAPEDDPDAEGEGEMPIDPAGEGELPPVDSVEVVPEP